MGWPSGLGRQGQPTRGPDCPYRAGAIAVQPALSTAHDAGVADAGSVVERTPRWRSACAPALPSILIALVWIGYASANSILEIQTFNSTSRDIGVYLQMLWGAGHGRPFLTTLLESNRVHLAEHLALLLPVLGPLYALKPDPRWLFVAQTTVLALAATPIYLLARRRLGGVCLPTLFVAGYFLMPTVTEVAFDAFYPIAWTALPLSFAAYFFLTDRIRPGVALALLAIPMEEEAGLAVLGLGIFLALRRGQRRIGLALAAFSLLWLGLVAMVAMPRFHEPSTLPSSGENRSVDHFAQLRQHPAETLLDLALVRTPRAIRWLIAPTGGLPLLAPHVLIIDAPQAATLLLADKGERFRRHWSSPLLPTIWLSAVVGFSLLRGRWLRAAGVAALIAGTLSCYLLDSNLPLGGDYDPNDLAWSDRAEQHAYLVERLPAGVSTVSSRRALGSVADRAEVYVFPPSYAGKLWPPERRPGAYLLDLSNDGTWEALVGRQSPLRASRPYAIWLAGPEAMLLLDRPPEPSQVLDRDVGGVRLHGYDRRVAGDTLELTLHWQGTAKVGRLTRTAQVILNGPGGPQTLTERGSVLDDLWPTDLWQPGQIVLERLRFPSGDAESARLVVGWDDGQGRSAPSEIPLGRLR
ncbi:MAG: DUF2079 domain-containing protein [Chloroflexi bacterium]|nr:DUF2079 domain-containing protein [Chloroflexota bacterium]